MNGGQNSSPMTDIYLLSHDDKMLVLENEKANFQSKYKQQLKKVQSKLHRLLISMTKCDMFREMDLRDIKNRTYGQFLIRIGL